MKYRRIINRNRKGDGLVKEKVKNIMGIAMPLMLAVLLVMNIFTLLKVNDMQSVISAATGDRDVAQENDVTIGSEYVIKDTTAISDAYKSGRTTGLSDKEKETLDLASGVLDEIITDGMSDYEKELAVYDWMTHNLQFDRGSLLVVPNSTADCDNPYGVLKYHNAVCVGYATTFRLFMQMMGIECMVVHDSYLSHSWDLVKLGGQWYHTDIYSDAGTGDYTHFNINDTVWAQEHEWNRDFFPAADGYEYNYAYMNREKCKDVYEIPALVRTALDDQKSAVAFEFEEKITETEAQIADAMMQSIESSAAFSEYNMGLTWSWMPVGDSYVFCVYIQNYNDVPIDDTTDLPDDVYEKIAQAVEAAFGDAGDVSDGDDTYDAAVIGGDYSSARID